MHDSTQSKVRPLCGIEHNASTLSHTDLTSSAIMPENRSGQTSWNSAYISKHTGATEGGTEVSQSFFSAHSVVVSSGGSCIEGEKVVSDTGNSCLVLKEHDYIGLAEVSSVSIHNRATDNESIGSNSLKLNPEETDLRLGLGPPEVSVLFGPRDGKASSGKQSLTGFQNSLSVASGGDSGSGNAMNTGRHVRATQEANQLLHAAAVNGEFWKELAWLDKQDASNIGWMKSESRREDEVGLDASATQGLQTPSQYEPWSRQDVRFPHVGNAGHSYVSEASAPYNLWHANLFRRIETTRASPTQASMYGQQHDAGRSAVSTGFSGSTAISTCKNGVKRGYSEVMAATGYSAGCNINAIHDANASTGGPVKAILQLPEPEVQHMGKQQPPALVYNWATVKPPGSRFWQFGPEQTGGSHQMSAVSMPSKSPTASNGHLKEMSDSSVVTWDKSKIQGQKLVHTGDNSQHGMIENDQANDAPPQKGQVVGWPPIRSFRKNTLAAHPKPIGDVDGASDSAITGPDIGQNCLYVKVTMDGVPIGRKVDLNAYISYEGLFIALEEMFQGLNSGQRVFQTTSARENSVSCDSKQLLLNGSDYVLTYEDKEGDWMLVGDVPWNMFVNAVKRLRIMKSAEATGLAPRGLDKSKYCAR